MTRRWRSWWIAAGVLGGLGLFLGGGCSTPIEVPPLRDVATTEQHPGRFVWHDLVTPDVESAQVFYGALFGWTFAPVGDGRYVEIRLNGERIGGLVDGGATPQRVSEAYWICGVSCSDVDAAATAMRTAGGTVVRGPADLPHRGRVAIVRDPEGALLQLIDSSSGDPAEGERPMGGWLWHELIAEDPAGAAAFYTVGLPYEIESIDVGDDEVYRVLNAGDRPCAGVRANPFEDTASLWIPFIRVEDPEAVVAKVSAAGGRVAIPPRATFRDSSVALILDPAGAPLAVQRWLGPREEAN